METKLKRRLAVGAAGLAVAGGAGGAYAAGKSAGENQRQAFLSDVAGRLHVTPQQLTSAMQGALADRLQQAVKSGRITQEQANRIEQRLKERGARPFLAGPKLHRFGGFGLRRMGAGPLFPVFDAAAKYVGLTDAQLAQQLAAGKSLAQVATAQGKSVDGLKQAIRDAVDAQLNAHLDQIVNHTGFGPPGPPPGMPGP